MLDVEATKLSFAVCCSFYNDQKSLNKMLQTTAGNFEFIFCVDGRYKYTQDDPDNNAPKPWGEDEFFKYPLSTDGSREVVKSYKSDNAILLDAPDLRESEKREFYIDVARQYQVDCILTLDSDEYVWYAEWEKFRRDAFNKMVVRDRGLWNIYNIDTREDRSFMPRPRLWYKPWELNYGLTHYEFYRKDDPTRALITLGGDEYHLVDHILTRHDRRLRTLDHILARERWEFAQQMVEDMPVFADDWSGLKHVKHADERYDKVTQKVVKLVEKEPDKVSG